MTVPTTQRPARTPTNATLLALVGVLSAAVLFLAGRWSVEPAAGAPAPHPGATAGRRPVAPPAERAWTPRAPSPAADPEAAPLQPVTSSPVRATPEQVTQATAQTAALLEASRDDLKRQCWPQAGAAGGPSEAVVTFNVTYDASGREIARGLTEDRRARTPGLIGCLQRLPFGSLRIPPPGANVGVRVALRLP